MAHQFAARVFTPRVRDLQTKAGSRTNYAAMDKGEDYNHLLTEREASFIAVRDSFYMASVSETGWPYVQHRGGPAGFVKVIDAKRIGFADYSGNRQYVSTGNFLSDNRVALFFMDYPNRRRLKMLGRVEVVGPEDLETLAALEDPSYLAKVERGFVIYIEAFDWNCPQHITPRFTEEQIREVLLPSLREEALQDAGRAPEVAVEKASEIESVIGDGPLELVISGMRQLTPRIRSFELRSPDGADLPEVSAGSHLRVPVRLANGQLADREYSIASDPARRDVYEIAVLKEDEGRGGSRAVHEQFALGTTLKTDMPLNQFALHEDDRPAVLIAGGIGITPIRSMALAQRSSGKAFQMHYAGRRRAEMAFVNELEKVLADNLRVHSSDIERLDIDLTLASMPENAVVYVCGPSRLIEAVVASAKSLSLPADAIQFERFE